MSNLAIDYTKYGFTLNMAPYVADETQLNYKLKGQDLVGRRRYVSRIKSFVISDYNLGFLIGAYLSCGNVLMSTYNGIERGLVVWNLDRRDIKALRPRLEEALLKAFNLKLDVCKTIKSQSKPNRFICYNRPLSKWILANLGKTTSKRFPNEFLVNNRPFLTGIADGIRDFRGNVPDEKRKAGSRTRLLNQNTVQLYQFLTDVLSNTERRI